MCQRPRYLKSLSFHTFRLLVVPHRRGCQPGAPWKRKQKDIRKRTTTTTAPLEMCVTNNTRFIYYIIYKWNHDGKHIEQSFEQYMETIWKNHLHIAALHLLRFQHSGTVFVNFMICSKCLHHWCQGTCTSKACKSLSRRPRRSSTACWASATLANAEISVC